MGDHAESRASGLHPDDLDRNSAEGVERDLRTPDRTGKYLAEELPGHVDSRWRAFCECCSLHSPESCEVTGRQLYVVARPAGSYGEIRSGDLASTSSCSQAMKTRQECRDSLFFDLHRALDA